MEEESELQAVRTQHNIISPELKMASPRARRNAQVGAAAPPRRVVECSACDSHVQGGRLL
eukprot:6028423-Prymnesium_polylepis.1